MITNLQGKVFKKLLILSIAASFLLISVSLYAAPPGNINVVKFTRLQNGTYEAHLSYNIPPERVGEDLSASVSNAGRTIPVTNPVIINATQGEVSVPVDIRCDQPPLTKGTTVRIEYSIFKQGSGNPESSNPISGIAAAAAYANRLYTEQFVKYRDYCEPNIQKPGVKIPSERPLKDIRNPGK